MLGAAKETFQQSLPLQAPFATPAVKTHRMVAGSPEIHSMHAAKWLVFPQWFSLSVITMNRHVDKPNGPPWARA
jgi:hypothetical protein